uniref:Uncharacterized protein n=1 Tax=Bionectria ochroleuca TaxID=29856 RepID=A0A8H7NM59_BIOOC
MQHKSGDKGSAHCGSVAVSIVGIVFGSAIVIVVCSFIYCLIRRQLNLRDKYARCNGNCECEGASRPPPPEFLAVLLPRLNKTMLLPAQALTLRPTWAIRTRNDMV